MYDAVTQMVKYSYFMNLESCRLAGVAVRDEVAGDVVSCSHLSCNGVDQNIETFHALVASS